MARHIAQAMPQNWEVKGLHALGYAGIRKKLPSVKLDTSGNALYEFVKEKLKSVNKEVTFKIPEGLIRELDSSVTQVTSSHAYIYWYRSRRQDRS